LGVSAKKAELDGRKDDAQKLYLEGEQAFNKATQLKGSLPEVWISFTQFYASLGKEEKSLEILEQAKKEVPPKELDFMLAQSYETLGKVKNAATYYRKAVRNAPEDFNIAKMAILFFLNNDFTDEAEILLKRITKKEINANKKEIAWAKRALGYTLIQQKGAGNIDATLALLDENLEANPNSILDLYTKATLLSNDPTGLGYTDAIKLFEQIKENQRNPGVTILQRLADLYYLTGQWSKFKVIMRDVLVKAGDHPKIIAIYAQRLAEHSEHGEAKVWLETLRGIDPDGDMTFSTECSLLMEEGDHAAVIKVINDWTNQKSDNSELKKRFEKAAGQCQKFATKLHREKKSSAAKIMERQAERLLKEHIKLEPKAKPSLAVLYAQQNNFEKAALLLQEIAEKSDPSQFALLVYACIKEANFSRNQLTQIESILKQVSDSHPDNVFVKMTLAFCEENFERPQQAEDILRKALKENPDNIPLMNYLAVTLALQEKDLSEARRLIEKVIKTAGPAPDFLDSRAMVSLAQNRPQAAIEDLRQALKEKPLSESFYFHLAEALYKKGFRKASKNALEKAHKLGLREAQLSPMERRNYRRLKMSLR
jgi:tetratricopeptide (TPR) repeat protein